MSTHRNSYEGAATNPNNCGSCDYKRLLKEGEEGWCYMLRNEPTYRCLLHTHRFLNRSPATGETS